MGFSAPTPIIFVDSQSLLIADSFQDLALDIKYEIEEIAIGNNEIVFKFYAMNSLMAAFARDPAAH